MGSQIIQDKFENIKGTIEDVTESAKADDASLLKQTVRPEFINRIDEIVMFTH
jgi:ATP-dependent Clp protease ATP-binding subunit ClpB